MGETGASKRVMVQSRSAGQFKGVSESETPPETPPGGVFRLAVLPLSRSPIAQGFSRPWVLSDTADAQKRICDSLM